MADGSKLVPAEAPDPSVDNSLEAQVARHFEQFGTQLVFPLPGDTESANTLEPPVSAEGSQGNAS